MAGFTLEAIFKSLSAMASKVTSQMRKQIQASVIPPVNPNGIITKTDITVTMVTPEKVNLHTNLPDYAWFANYGREPGRMPPWGEGTSLYQWARRHPYTDPNTGKPVSAESSSYLLARKIGLKGTKHDYGIVITLQRMIHLIEKTLPETVVKEFKATWLDKVYSDTELPRTIEVNL